jgi:hypothetical protein
MIKSSPKLSGKLKKEEKKTKENQITQITVSKRNEPIVGKSYQNNCPFYNKNPRILLAPDFKI